MKTVKINILLAVLLAFFLAFSPILVFAEINPQYVPPPQYPGTSIDMKPGDVLYSHKNWSTFFLGHTVIVGEDYRVYHSHPQSPYKFAESIDSYLSRHNSGDEITILRPRSGGLAAARWAKNNLSVIQSYSWNRTLSNIKNNYCSKFVWQSFWYGAGIDLTGDGLTGEDEAYIYPSEIKNSSHLIRQGIMTK